MSLGRQRENGFTLIELMLVVAVIGILAAVAIPAYQDYTTRARVIEAFSLAEPARHAVNEYYERWGRFPPDNAAAGLAAAGAYRGQAVRGLRVVNGVIELSLQPASSGTVVRNLYLRPAVNRGYPTGALAWVCGRRAAPDGFEPVGKIGENPVEDKHVPAACR